MAGKTNEIVKTHLHVGDLVQVVSGKGAAGRKRKIGEGDDARDRGVRGKILSINKTKGTAIVQGAKMVYKHQRSQDPNQPSPGRIEIEAPIHLSNLMLIDPETDQPTRVGVKVESVQLDNGKTKIRRTRYAKASGAELKS